MAEAGTILFSKGDQDVDQDDIWDDTALIKAYDKAINAAKDAIRHRKKASSVSESASDSNASTSVLTIMRNRRKRHAKSKWCVGSHCRAVYSVDGCLYEAEIESIDHQEGTCKVLFVGYYNSEDVSIDNLQPSKGAKARRKQVMDVTNQNKAQDNSVMPDVKAGDLGGGNSEGSHSRRSGSRHRTEQRSRSFHNYAFPRPPHTGMTYADGAFAPPPLMQVPPMHIPPPMLPLMSDDSEDVEDEALASMLMSWYMSGYHTGYYQGLKSGHNRAKCGCSHKRSGDSNYRRNCR